MLVFSWKAINPGPGIKADLQNLVLFLMLKNLPTCQNIVTNYVM